jgi:hypothetical protein
MRALAIVMVISATAVLARASPPAFPTLVAGFLLTESSPSASDKGPATAGYVLTTEDGAVSVTVRVRPARRTSLFPSIDRPADAEAEALGRAKAQVHRFYPDARVLEERGTLLMREGILRQGRMATFEFEDIFAGRKQAIRMTVYTFCCSETGRAYEYRFRHAAEFPAGLEIASFLRALPWD